MNGQAINVYLFTPISYFLSVARRFVPSTLRRSVAFWALPAYAGPGYPLQSFSRFAQKRISATIPSAAATGRRVMTPQESNIYNIKTQTYESPTLQGSNNIVPYKIRPLQGREYVRSYFYSTEMRLLRSPVARSPLAPSIHSHSHSDSHSKKQFPVLSNFRITITMRMKMNGVVRNQNSKFQFPNSKF